MTTTPPNSPISGEAPLAVAPLKPHALSIVALVTAAVGFIFACIPGALIVGWILLPIAFILSLVALFLKGKKWPALVGLILAVVGTIVGFVVFFSLVANAANEAFGGGGTTPSTPVATETAGVTPDDDEAESGSADYVVTIDSATQTTDYEGKPALVVNYTFTNNSEKDASFLVATSAKAFQDGVELDLAIVSDGSVDSGSTMNDVKPGATTTAQLAYSLTSTSEVTVEVSELFSFDDTLLATKSFTVQ